MFRRGTLESTRLLGAREMGCFLSRSKRVKGVCNLDEEVWRDYDAEFFELAMSGRRNLDDVTVVRLMVPERKRRVE